MPSNGFDLDAQSDFVGETFRLTWEVYSTHWRAMLPLLVALATIDLVELGVVLTSSYIPFVAPEHSDLANGIGWVERYVFLVPRVLLSQGIALLTLDSLRGRSPDVESLGTSLVPRLLPTLVVILITEVLRGFGLCLCLIPGLLVIYWLQFPALVTADARQGVFASLELGFELTEGWRLGLLLQGGAVAVLAIASSCVTMGLSTAVVGGLTAVLWGVTYATLVDRAHQDGRLSTLPAVAGSAS